MNNERKLARAHVEVGVGTRAAMPAAAPSFARGRGWESKQSKAKACVVHRAWWHVVCQTGKVVCGMVPHEPRRSRAEDDAAQCSTRGRQRGMCGAWRGVHPPDLRGGSRAHFGDTVVLLLRQHRAPSKSKPASDVHYIRGILAASAGVLWFGFSS